MQSLPRRPLVSSSSRARLGWAGTASKTPKVDCSCRNSPKASPSLTRSSKAAPLRCGSESTPLTCKACKAAAAKWSTAATATEGTCSIGHMMVDLLRASAFRVERRQCRMVKYKALTGFKIVSSSIESTVPLFGSLLRTSNLVSCALNYRASYLNQCKQAVIRLISVPHLQRVQQALQRPAPQTLLVQSLTQQPGQTLDHQLAGRTHHRRTPTCQGQAGRY